MRDFLSHFMRRIKQHRLLYIVACFVVVSGIFAGFYCATNFDTESQEQIRSVFICDGQEGFILVLLKQLWWKLVCVICVIFTSVFLFCLPIWLFFIVLLCSLWGVSWGCVLGPNFSLLAFILCLISAAIFIVCISELIVTAFLNLKRSFIERRIPKTSSDMLRDVLSGMGWFSKIVVIELIVIILEASVLPLLL